MAKYWLCFIILTTVMDSKTQTESARFCRGGWTFTKSCPQATDGEPEECIFIDATVIVDVRIASNVSCNYFSGEMGGYDGPSGVYGYSGKTVWLDQDCEATEFETCIGSASFCNSGLSTLVYCGVHADPDDVAECAVDQDNAIIDVRVNKRLSNKECYYYSGNHTAYTGYTGVYGFSSTIIWVYRGCGAVFDICTGYIQTTDDIFNQPLISYATVDLQSKPSERNTWTTITSSETKTEYMASTPTDYLPFSATQATDHSLTNIHMPLSPTVERTLSTTQATVSTSLSFTGTTIQVTMHTRIIIATVAGAVTGGLAGLAAIVGAGLYMMKYRASCQTVFPVFRRANRDGSTDKKQEESSNLSQD